MRTDDDGARRGVRGEAPPRRLRPASAYRINAGAYLLDPGVLDRIPAGRASRSSARCSRPSSAGPAARFPTTPTGATSARRRGTWRPTTTCSAAPCSPSHARPLLARRVDRSAGDALSSSGRREVVPQASVRGSVVGATAGRAPRRDRRRRSAAGARLGPGAVVGDRAVIAAGATVGADAPVPTGVGTARAGRIASAPRVQPSTARDALDRREPRADPRHAPPGGRPATRRAPGRGGQLPGRAVHATSAGRPRRLGAGGPASRPALLGHGAALPMTVGATTTCPAGSARARSWSSAPTRAAPRRPSRWPPGGRARRLASPSRAGGKLAVDAARGRRPVIPCPAAPAARRARAAAGADGGGARRMRRGAGRDPTWRRPRADRGRRRRGRRRRRAAERLAERARSVARIVPLGRRADGRGRRALEGPAQRERQGRPTPRPPRARPQRDLRLAPAPPGWAAPRAVLLRDPRHDRRSSGGLDGRPRAARATSARCSRSRPRGRARSARMLDLVAVGDYASARPRARSARSTAGAGRDDRAPQGAARAALTSGYGETGRGRTCATRGAAERSAARRPRTTTSRTSACGRGRRRIEWAEREMPVLRAIRERFAAERPLQGMRIARLPARHDRDREPDAHAARRRRRRRAVRLATRSRRRTTSRRRWCATTASPTFAIKGEDDETYYRHIDAALDHAPADHDGRRRRRGRRAARRPPRRCSTTSSAAPRRRRPASSACARMEADGVLEFPIIAVNDADTKHFFDNRYGTGQTTIDGIIRATNMLLAGRTFVVAGYGWCGRGLAEPRARHGRPGDRHRDRPGARARGGDGRLPRDADGRGRAASATSSSPSPATRTCCAASTSR